MFRKCANTPILLQPQLMWTIWTKWNQRSFEDTGKSLAQLLDLCHRTLFGWSRCWDLSDCSTLMDFLLSLRIG